jgi:flagellar biosynthetic protein FliP
MLSELRTAFQVGFVIFLPFLLIDLIVASVRMALGMMMVPPSTVSVPLKLLLFVLIDGWNIVTRSLLGTIH